MTISEFREEMKISIYSAIYFLAQSADTVCFLVVDVDGTSAIFEMRVRG